MKMSEPYLEVTYRHGRAVAAYYYLPRKAGDEAARTERRESGLLVDYAADGRPIGLEITAPSQISRAFLDTVLTGLGCGPLAPGEFDPLLAA
jgi:hypothetical protein